MTTVTRLAARTEVFDSAHDAILNGDVYDAMDELRTALRELRSRLPSDDWRTVGEDARRHPLHRLLLESPFTRRAYEKPRGYAGDAVLMGLIYGMVPPDDVDPRIPFRNLPQAQRQLESAFTEDIIVERWSPRLFVAITRVQAVRLRHPRMAHV